MCVGCLQSAGGSGREAERPSPGAPRYLQAEDVLAVPQGHGLPQDAGAVGRGRRNAAALTHAALRESASGGSARLPAAGT